MEELKVKDIIKIANAKLIMGDSEETLENFKKDTREIEKGDTYVGFKGEKLDGSKLFDVAFEKGAKAAIIEDIEIDDEILKKYPRKNTYKN